MNTPLAISAKNGQELTINDLPNYANYDKSGWVAMLVDFDKMTGTAEPYPDGDYLYKEFCTIDREAKTLTFAGGVVLTNWEVGDNLVLYNVFLNYEFVGDQTTAPLISTSGAPTWRAGQTVGGGIYKNPYNSFYYWFFTGITAGGVGSIGYAGSFDLITWNIGMSDAPLLTHSDFPSCTSISTTGSVYFGGEKDIYFFITCVNNSNPTKNIPRIVYFNFALDSFTYSDPLLTGDAERGYVASSVVKIGDYYHLAYSAQYTLDRDREQRMAKSLTLDADYVDYQTVVVGTGSNDGVQWSWSADGISIFDDGNRIWGLFGGFSCWAKSGGRGNRYFCLINYNPVTGLWSIDEKGPVIINPLYYGDLAGIYTWADDHCGGYVSLFNDNGMIYMSLTMNHGVGTYQVALIKLKYN